MRALNLDINLGDLDINLENLLRLAKREEEKGE